MSINIQKGDLIMTRLEFKQATSGVGYNILHWRVDDLTVASSGLPPAVAVPYSTIAEGVAKEIYDLCSLQWSAIASNQCSFTGVTLQSLLPFPRSTPFTYSADPLVVGAVNAEALPLQDSPTLLKKTEYGERWGLGRLYFYGLSEEGQSNGIILPLTKAALETFGGQLDGPITMTVAGFVIKIEPIILHNVPRDGQIYHRIIGMPLSNEILKTQRRRRPGKGI